MRATVGLATLLLASAAAQPSSLRFEQIEPSDGLSGFAVAAVETDTRGFVWFGTVAAVDRFDGVRIRAFEAGVSREDGYVYALALGADGTLWAGGREGLWRRSPDALTFEPVVFGSIGPIDVRALAVDEDALWIGTMGDGLIRLHHGRVRRFTRGRGTLPSDTVRSLLRQSSGALVVATSGGVSQMDVEDGRVRHDKSLTDVRALAETAGDVWAGRADGSVLSLATDGSRTEGAGPPISALVPSRVWPGIVWVGYRGGGVRLLDTRTGTLHGLPPASGLPEAFGQSEVLALAEHRGVLWVGTTDGVLYADVSPPRFQSVRGPPDGPLTVPATMSVHISGRDPGVVWAGTVQGGLHRIDRRTGAVERWFGTVGHPLGVLFDIQEDAAGDVWLGGRSPDLWRLRPSTGETERLSLAPGRGGLVADITPSRHFPGHLWVGTSEAGLIRVDTDTRRGVVRYDMAAGAARLPSSVWQTAEADGVLWVATDGEGLWRLDLESSRAERVAPMSCEIDDELVSVTVGARDVWIGSAEEHLFRLDWRTGSCQTYTPDDGLPPTPVGAVFEDRRGFVWGSSNLGLWRFDLAADVFTLFSRADGLAASTLYWYARSQSASGEIAIGGAGGLTVFDPLDVLVDTTAFPVVLTGLSIDGEEHPVVPGAPLSFPHHQNDIAFEYAVLDLRQPAKTQYRVRLLGASDRWETEGAETRYRALAPGRYTFEVRATNRDGYWSAPLAVPVRIRPPFWQTVPFWLLIMTMLGSVGYAAHRYRVAQIQRVDRTRRRIADDLHDDIGSKISSVALRLDMVGLKSDLPENAQTALATLSQTARSVVGDLRDTVWLVDAAHDDLAAVVSRMEQFAVVTLDGRGTVQAPYEVPPLALSMETRRDLYLLFTEALHNAVRHSGAQHISVWIGVEPKAIAFTVEDEGVGFDPTASTGGRGLDTMRRRATALGGHLRWDPRDGGGTAVRFSVDIG